MAHSDGRRVSRRRRTLRREDLSLAREGYSDPAPQRSVAKFSWNTVRGSSRGTGQNCSPAESAAVAAAVTFFWHTFVGMDSADDTEVIDGDGGEKEAVDSVAGADSDVGGGAADVHVG